MRSLLRRHWSNSQLSNWIQHHAANQGIINQLSQSIILQKATGGWNTTSLKFKYWETIKHITRCLQDFCLSSGLWVMLWGTRTRNRGSLMELSLVYPQLLVSSSSGTTWERICIWTITFNQQWWAHFPQTCLIILFLKLPIAPSSDLIGVMWKEHFRRFQTCHFLALFSAPYGFLCLWETVIHCFLTFSGLLVILETLSISSWPLPVVVPFSLGSPILQESASFKPSTVTWQQSLIWCF